MAFTAVHYPMDKDQRHLAYWSDNDELGAMAPESFFDQFVTFDAGDPGATTVGLSADDMFEEDPPSPSLLLDSLKDDNSLANSSNVQQDRLSDIGRPAAAAAATEAADCSPATTTAAIDAAFTIPPPGDISDAAVEHHHLQHHFPHNGSSTPPPDLLSVLTGDPVLGGSISDSELLRLEGISLRSPRANATAPSSPPLLAQQQTGTPPSLSPRKHHRFVESVYATVRRATHRSSRPVVADHNRPSGSPHGTQIMETAFKRGVVRPSRQYQPPQQHHYQQQQQGPDAHMGHNIHQTAIKPEHVVDNDGLPLSPPLTGTIPTPGHHHHHGGGGMRFVSGSFDDPFCDGLMGSAAATSSSTTIQGQDTPLHTPVLEGGDAFYQHAMSAVTESAGNNRGSSGNQGKHESQLQSHHDNVAAAWSTMDGLLATSPTDDAQLWASSSAAAAAPVYIAETGINHHNSNGGGELPSPGWWETDCEGGGHHPQPHVSNSNSNNNAVPMHNASLLQQQQQQQITAADLSAYDYGSLGGETDELSGLMIHMPQPRQPQAAVLSAAAANNLNLNGGSGDGSNEAAAAAAAANDAAVADDRNGGGFVPTRALAAAGTDGSSFPMPTLSSTPSRHHQHYQQQQYQPHQHTPHQHHGGHAEQRRPRPRAPSSGARHHGSSMTSPRKLHHSRSAFSIRESSMSPTPTTHHPHPHGHGHGGRPHLLPPYPPHYHQQHPHPHPHPHPHRSSSISVRKRRSFNGGSTSAGRRGASASSSSNGNGGCEPPHTPRSATASGSFGHGIGIGIGGGGGGGSLDADGGGLEAGAGTPPGRASSSGSGSGSGRAGTIGFVNFTPSDKNVLMTGVAPSGSSKTKARREKELADRQRRISEATIRAVKEAGGDVDKFIEQGLWGGVFVGPDGNASANANGQQQQQQQHHHHHHHGGGGGGGGHVEHGGHGGHSRAYVGGERC